MFSARELIQRLSSTDDRTRWNAARMLGEAAARGEDMSVAIEPLMHAMQEERTSVIMYAQSAMVKLVANNKSKEKALTAVVRGISRKKLRSPCEYVLRNSILGPEELSIMVKPLAKLIPNREVGTWVLHTLLNIHKQDIGIEAVLPELLDSRRNERICREVDKLIGAVISTSRDEQQVKHHLLASLDEGNYAAKLYVAKYFEEKGFRRVELKDKVFCLIILGKEREVLEINEPGVIDALLLLTNVPGRYYQQTVIRILERHQGERVERVLDELRRTDRSGKEDLTHEFGKRGSKKVVGELISNLRDKDRIGIAGDAAVVTATIALGKIQLTEEQVHEIVDILTVEKPIKSMKDDILLLGKINDSRVGTRVAGLLEFSRWEIRAAAATVIGECRAIQVIPELIKALKDVSLKVRAAAATALGACGVHDTARELIDKLETEPKPKVKKSIILALGDIGSDDAFTVILQCLKESDPEIKCAAIMAIDRLEIKLKRNAISHLIDCLDKNIGKGDTAKALKKIIRETGLSEEQFEELLGKLKQRMGVGIKAILDVIGENCIEENEERLDKVREAMADAITERSLGIKERKVLKQTMRGYYSYIMKKVRQVRHTTYDGVLSEGRPKAPVGSKGRVVRIRRRLRHG